MAKGKTIVLMQSVEIGGKSHMILVSSSRSFAITEVVLGPLRGVAGMIDMAVAEKIARRHREGYFIADYDFSILKTACSLGTRPVFAIPIHGEDLKDRFEDQTIRDDKRVRLAVKELTTMIEEFNEAINHAANLILGIKRTLTK
jgi:hypothetical protein